jgi:hypothetical protein
MMMVVVMVVMLMVMLMWEEGKGGGMYVDVYELVVEEEHYTSICIDNGVMLQTQTVDS